MEREAERGEMEREMRTADIVLWWETQLPPAARAGGEAGRSCRVRGKQNGETGGGPGASISPSDPWLRGAVGK